MSEKQKWFRPSPAAELRAPTSFVSGSRVSAAQLQQLLAEIERKCGQGRLLEFFANLAEQTAVQRLQRNLCCLVSLLAEGATALYTDVETEHLTRLARYNLSSEQLDTAYALLNTHERYQAQLAMRGLFRAASCQRHDRLE